MLHCHLINGNYRVFFIILVSTLPGLLMSPDLYSTVTLEEAQHLPPLTQFMVSGTLETWILPQDPAQSNLLLKPIRILYVCGLQN